MRASDLGAPAQPGHLVRQFGQSDRDQIEASHRDANVPQVLALMNGFVETSILRPNQGVMMMAIEDAKGARAKIQSAYLSILSRKPKPSEVTMWQKDIKKLGSKAYQDLVWTLLNSHEFRFIQ